MAVARWDYVAHRDRPRYAGKTIDLCAPEDPICSVGQDDAAHTMYATNGMAIQAADFAAQHL